MPPPGSALLFEQGARPPGKVERLVSVDVLRGIVMVIMALDHTRDFFTGLRFPPEDITQTYGALFFTRWITHFCAPAFFFLAGTGAFLSAARGKTLPELSRFLWTRGLWLVFLELTVVAFAWTFFLPFGPFGLVIWALGWSMVAMSLIVRLPLRWIAVFGIVMIALHNLADRINPAQLGKIGWLWSVLHVPGFIPIQPPRIGFFVLYPLIPWVGVMAVGYAFGAILLYEPQRRRKVTFAVGGLLTLAFVLLRATNLYGNAPAGLSFGNLLPSAGDWHVQKSATMTLIAFLNVQKYPPSLQFLLMTLGPALMALALLDCLHLDGLAGALGRFFLVFGRVPMFYYVLHLYLIHALAVVVALLFHQPARWLLGGAFIFQPLPDGYGHGLPFIYLIWMTVILLLYFPCRWFMGVKQRRTDWWLSYM